MNTVSYPFGTLNAFQPVEMTKRGTRFTDPLDVQFSVPPEGSDAVTWVDGATLDGDLGFWIPAGLAKGRYDVIARPTVGTEDTQVRVGSLVIN